MRFSALYNTQSLALYTAYPTPDGDSISIQVLNFLVSDIRLVTTDDKEVVLLNDDSKFINFDSPTAQMISLADVPAGSYKSIRFGVGVQPSLNAKVPSDFSSSSPLGDISNYWSAWDSYIFSRIEGQLDTSRTSDQTLPFLYHSGVASMYQERTFSKTFDVVEGNSSTVLFTLQADEIFYPVNFPVDIRSINVSHSAAVGTAQYEIARTVVFNLANALTLQ
jgi:tRNA(Leu) C34 or U34 (ribose-2'-O)-methylase TrmL